MMQTQKITAILPKELLQSVLKSTGLGITESIKQGLEHLMSAKAYENLQKCRGKYADCFKDFDLNELRKDRDEE
ncbi:MAG: hypothetical protein KBD83_02160 [Gammaproteobacteria bacterium]|nr:hypothetical protein [Gammaproteobacteria bacterium]